MFAFFIRLMFFLIAAFFRFFLNQSPSGRGFNKFVKCFEFVHIDTVLYVRETV